MKPKAQHPLPESQPPTTSRRPKKNAKREGCHAKLLSHGCMKGGCKSPLMKHIFAAQSVLRHAQISTTAAYYTDKNKRITAGLGSLLSDEADKVYQHDFDPAADASQSAGIGKNQKATS